MSRNRSRAEQVQKRVAAALAAASSAGDVRTVERFQRAVERPARVQFPSPWTPQFAAVVGASRVEGGRLRVELSPRSGAGGRAGMLITADDSPEHYAAALRLLHGEPAEMIPDTYDPDRDPWKAACEQAADAAHEEWLHEVLLLLDAVPVELALAVVDSLPEPWPGPQSDGT